MKTRFYPYQILLLLVGGISMFALLKMDKMSFYHHYFRVIEDVEGRNSQEWVGEVFEWGKNYVHTAVQTVAGQGASSLFSFSFSLEQETLIFPTLVENAFTCLIPALYPTRGP